MLQLNQAEANVSWPLNNSTSHCIAGKLRSDSWQHWSLMRGSSVISVIGKEENKTLPVLLTQRLLLLLCPLSFPLLQATSQWPSTLTYPQLTEGSADKYVQKERQHSARHAVTLKLRDTVRVKAQTGEEREKEQQVQNSCKPSKLFYH